MVVLDTHTVIWLTQEPARLSGPARKALVEGRAMGELAVAGFSLYELADLIARRRVAVDRPLEQYLHFVESLFLVIPLTAAIAGQAVRFSRAYPKDPADRLIGATAVVHRAKLVTKDGPIRDSGEVDCVW